MLNNVFSSTSYIYYFYFYLSNLSWLNINYTKMGKIWARYVTIGIYIMSCRFCNKQTTGLSQIALNWKYLNVYITYRCNKSQLFYTLEVQVQHSSESAECWSSFQLVGACSDIAMHSVPRSYRSVSWWCLTPQIPGQGTTLQGVSQGSPLSLKIDKAVIQTDRQTELY